MPSIFDVAAIAFVLVVSRSNGSWLVPARLQKTLRCQQCAVNESTYYIDPDPFQRISFGLLHGRCHRHDTVLCDQAHDLCINIIIFSTNSSVFSARPFQVIKGCSRKVLYNRIVTAQPFCTQVRDRAYTKTICLCSADFCNTALPAQVVRWHWVAILCYLVAVAAN